MPPVFIALRTAPISAVVAISLILNSFAFAESSPDKLSSEAAFKTATELMGKGEFKRAIPYLSRVQRELPDDGSVLWNLGLAFAATGEHSKAVETWQSYRRIEPDDWAARAKLVQAYQALGDVKARDDEIKSLYEFRNNSSDPKVNTAERFCREQGVIANRSVFVFEYFAPPGPRPQYLRFCILNKKGEVDYYLSLGSYDDTTAIARELGELKEDERLYHLDEYTDTGHRTFAFFKTRPEYEEVRSAVVRALGGKSKPISGSSISK
ncbi:MAG TPA: tetratricopeptide repeat protein [Chthoniobacterales bacterium]|nr:tetratricopeptide repeat protein [Chthoniobacterales bacterium]